MRNYFLGNLPNVSQTMEMGVCRTLAYFAIFFWLTLACAGKNPPNQVGKRSVNVNHTNTFKNLV